MNSVTYSVTHFLVASFDYTGLIWSQLLAN